MHIHSSRDWTKTTKNRLNQARGERMIPTHARTYVCVLILATRVRVLVCAMARRFYNEHLHYPDPFSAASKSTRHRQLKKRKLSVENTEEPSRPDHTDTLLLGTTVLSPLDFAENLEASDVDVSDNEATEGHHEQFSAENELHNAVEEDYGEFCADNNDDLPDEERFTAEDQSSLSSSEAMVFQNCPLTVTSSLLLIKKYQMRHKLTQEALSDLLQLMRLHFPTPNLLPSSLYLFNKQLPVLANPLEYTYFCSRCLQELPSKDESTCSNSACGYSLSGPGAISSFIEVPLEPQLVTLLQSMYVLLCSVSVSYMFALRKGHVFYY